MTRVDLDQSVVTAFERQVDLHPARPALVTATQQLTYRLLDTAANRVANVLQARRGEVSEPVPLLVADPALMLIAALGVLKAGKFYVPVNPYFPTARIRLMLSDVAPAVVLHDDGARAAAGAVPPGQGLRLEDLLSGPGVDARPGTPIGPERLAYILYTSGSTGRPKGVAQVHRNVLHNVLRHAALGIGPEDRVTLLSPDGFVGAVSNVTIALLNGAALVPYSFRAGGVHGLLEWLEQRRVTVYYSFPSFFRQLVAVAARPPQAWGLRLLYLGGELVAPGDIAAARELFPEATVAVGLNSTETGLTRLRLFPPHEEVPREVLPVGGPVPGVEVRIVDEAGQRVADGCPGEIAVVSRYIRPWYWRPGRPCEDATVAVPGDDARVFRTGDRGYINPLGELVHLGRVDAMVKVRGYRVELAEVESGLNSLPGVAEAVVVPHTPTPEETELVAYVVPREPGLDGREIHRRLAELLPEAMVPSVFVLLKALPRTANGKVSRRDLPPPPTRRLDPDARQVAPRDPVEEAVARIWSTTLATPAVGISDNFFELGGHSILAVRVISAIRREFGVAVPLRVLFETPTVEALASAVRQLQGSVVCAGEVGR